MAFLRNTGKISSIGLWGRSMGAATAIIVGSKDPTISAICADSPFSNLKKLAIEVNY